jgi:4-amino-4-deoxy-L-arabinose transferase-like glycosyltransferase
MELDAQIEETISPDAAKEAADSSWIAQRSIVDGLYLLALVGAAVIRFTDLEGLPLSPAEASEALAAWQFLQPDSAGATIGSPAYFTLTSLLMAVIGASDAIARLVPALFGLGLVSLPWLLRAQIGPVGALVCAAFLAASPLNSTISRTAGGDAIALFAILLTFLAVAKLRRGGREAWFYGLTVALGLGLTSSPVIYGGLLSVSLAWLVTSLVSNQPVWGIGVSRSTLRNGVIAGLLVFLGLSTRFLTYPAGLGASAQLLGEWFGQFGVGGGLQGALAPLLVLGRYELTILVAGTAAVMWAIWKNTSSGILSTFWLLTIVGLMLLQNGYLHNALLATLPGYLLVGVFSAVVFRKPVGQWTWLLSGGLLLIGAVVLVNLGRYLRVSVYEPDLSNLWLGVLALAAVDVGTDNDLPILLETLQDVSREVTNSDSGLTILSAVDTPVLRWYLREYGRAVIGEAVPPNAQQQAIVSLASEREPQFGADYVGSDFGLLRRGTTAAPESVTPLADLLRWWLFQETIVEMIEDRVILWVRSDTVQPRQ